MALVFQNSHVFLHAPKTGGTWVSQFIKENFHFFHWGPKHATWDYLQGTVHGGNRNVPGAIQDIPGVVKPVTIIRDPLDWVTSLYRYSVGKDFPTWGYGNLGGNWHPLGGLEVFPNESFESYISRLVADRPGFVSRLFLRYADDSSVTILNQSKLSRDFLLFIEAEELEISVAPPLTKANVSVGNVPQLSPGLKTRFLNSEMPLYESLEKRIQLFG